jgi:Plasmid encoded RepA protein
MTDKEERKKRRADKIIQHALGMADKEAQEVGSITFSPRCTLLATLPHRDPGNLPFFVRRNGDYTLTIQPGTALALDQETGLMLGYPFGAIPRLILAWLTTEAVRTKSKTIYLGESLADFLRQLKLGNHGGVRGDITRLRNHLERLFGATISIHYHGARRKKSERLSVMHQTFYWWDPEQNMKQDEPQRAAIVLAEEFYREIIDCPVPLDLRIIHALKHSSLALDIYSWLTYRMSYLKKKTLIPWASLALQFGSDYARLRDFKVHFIEQLTVVKALYSHARFSTESEGGLTLYPSRPQVLKVPKDNLL